MSWWRRYLFPTESAAEEAAQQRYDKSAKIQTALEGVMVRSLNEIDRQERGRVNRYYERMGLPSGVRGDDEMIIADNITTVRGSPVLQTLGALLLGGGLTWAALAMSGVIGGNDTDTDTRNTVRFGDDAVEIPQPRNYAE